MGTATWGGRTRLASGRRTGTPSWKGSSSCARAACGGAEHAGGPRPWGPVVLVWSQPPMRGRPKTTASRPRSRPTGRLSHSSPMNVLDPAGPGFNADRFVKPPVTGERGTRLDHRSGVHADGDGTDISSRPPRWGRRSPTGLLAAGRGCWWRQPRSRRQRPRGGDGQGGRRRAARRPDRRFVHLVHLAGQATIYAAAASRCPAPWARAACRLVAYGVLRAGSAS